jgi:hypothetical protein
VPPDVVVSTTAWQTICTRSWFKKCPSASTARTAASSRTPSFYRSTCTSLSTRAVTLNLPPSSIAPTSNAHAACKKTAHNSGHTNAPRTAHRLLQPKRTSRPGQFSFFFGAVLSPLLSSPLLSSPHSDRHRSPANKERKGKSPQGNAQAEKLAGNFATAIFVLLGNNGDPASDDNRLAPGQKLDVTEHTKTGCGPNCAPHSYLLLSSTKQLSFHIG